MLYELSDEQAQQLRMIIGAANIKGADALVIIGLMQALGKPMKEEKDG